MRPGDILISTFEALRLRALRSVLSMTGITIGVASVIATVAVGDGGRNRVLVQVQNLGTNLITVLPGSVTLSGVRLGSGAAPSLTDKDAEAIQSEIPAAELVASFKFAGYIQAIAANQNWATVVFGAHDGWSEASDWHTGFGRGFSPDELKSAAQVAILGETVARRLFPGESPIGNTIRLRHVPLQVIGILAPRGPSPQGQDRDDLILVPLTTSRQRISGSATAKSDSLSWFSVKARNREDLSVLESDVRALLRQRHGLQPYQVDDFTIRNRNEVIAAEEGNRRTLSILLISVAAVALFVGGIGITNILLASVTERTREIGLRLALGARRKDIRRQFLCEAMGLAFVGGLLGAGSGTAASRVIAAYGGWSVSIDPQVVLLTVAGASLVGLGAGMYPAVKASLLNPIDALRHR